MTDKEMKRLARHTFARADRAKKEGKPMLYKQLRIQAAKLMNRAMRKYGRKT